MLLGVVLLTHTIITSVSMTKNFSYVDDQKNSLFRSINNFGSTVLYYLHFQAVSKFFILEGDIFSQVI